MKLSPPESRMYLVLCALVFALTYTLNLLMISIGYHRGLAHSAVELGPGLRKIVITSGNWVTGLDPKAWVVMHRMHHVHSDTPRDPHSPVNVGIRGVGLEQLRSYERVLTGLARGNPVFTQHAEDLDFDLNWLNRNRLWMLPYGVHAGVGLVLVALGGWLLGGAYFLGMMSHPVQGGMVNAFGHAVGGRNFDTDDNSRNNLAVAWLVMGEGLQNNHHRFPRSAKFSYRRWESDPGFAWCLAFETLGLLQINADQLIPSPPPLRRLEPAST
jgi:stearoyl-CoA desaturase (delta-9 desaturase)